MPLFGRRAAEPVATTTTTAPGTSNRRSGLFGRGQTTSHSTAGHTTTTAGTTATGHQHGGLLHRHQEDGSIVAARDRVNAAEHAEREADRALLLARNAVREARAHVKRLEIEAGEE